MSQYLAIDPGAKGALAYTYDGSNVIGVQTLSDPPCMEDLSTFSPSHYTVVVEDIPMGGWGPIPQSTVAKLHQGYGRILGMCEVRGFRVIRVKPQELQKSVGAGQKKYHGKGWKKHLAQLARERFPAAEFKVDQADAVLMLDHAIRNRL
jgi:hypothetical protein